MDDHSISPGLSWQNLTFSVSVGSRKNAHDKVLLQGVSGHAHKGELTAIMGPSGSGKTTLLNILTGRIDTKSKTQGVVLFENKKRDPDSWKKVIGYVEQADLMYDSLTGWETIAFSAMTRLPRTFSSAQRLAKAEDVVQTLGLQKARDTMVGSETKKGMSGGERKRVAVGCELVTDPKLLCLDECTSGLDSQSAFSVISTLRQISRLDVAVLCTIHQPSYELFCKFDQLILMALGRIAFRGTIPDAILHFEKLGYPLPSGANAADHFISLLTEPGNQEDVSENEKNRVVRLLDAWRDTEVESSVNAMETQIDAADENKATTVDDPERKGFGLGYAQELYWVTKRAWTQQLRAPENIWVGFVQSIFLSIIMGFTFFRLGDGPGDVIGRAGLLFFIPIQNSFGVLFPIINFVPTNVGILIRERRMGAYRVSTYYLSRFSVEIPVAIVTRMLFFVLIYWMCNLRDDARAFFIFIAMNCCTILVAIAMGLFISALSKNFAIVQLATPALNVVFILFAGFLLPQPNIPHWFIWIHWIGYATYVFAGLCINEFKGRVFQCTPGANSVCYSSGQSFLDAYDLESFSIGANFGFLFAIIFAFSILGYFKLRHLTRPKLTLI